MAINKETKEHEVVYGPLNLDIDEMNIKKPKDSIILYLSAIGACFMTMSVGGNGVWVAPITSKLIVNDTDINPMGESLTTFQIAILTGLTAVGAAFGSLFLTAICDKIGRKKTIIFLIGIGGGVGMSVVSVFLSEISEDHNRGSIGCIMGLSFPMGRLYVYVLGPLFSIKIYTLLCIIPNILNFLCFLVFIPESPFYLALTGERQKTIKALEQLRNKNASNVEKEYEEIEQTVSNTSNEEEVTWKTMFSVKSLKNGLIIAVTLNVLQQLSGIFAILTYAGYLFSASGIALTGDEVAVLIGVTNVFGILLAIMIIERIGRRPLLMVSTLGGSIPHFLLGFYFYLENTKSQFLNSFLWLPVVSVLVFIVFYSVGLGVIPNSIMSELFPSNAKSKGSSASCFVNYLTMGLVTTLFPIINQFIGSSWCLCSFGLIEALSFLYVYFCVPEIKGKSLAEVQHLLSK